METIFSVLCRVHVIQELQVLRASFSLKPNFFVSKLLVVYLFAVQSPLLSIAALTL